MQEPGPRTLYDKLWDEHVVDVDTHGDALLYVDLHLIHEVTTPQAFDGLAASGRRVRRPDRTLAVADHNVPTEGQSLGIAGVSDPQAREQLSRLQANTDRHGITAFRMGDPENGIVHVVGPEQGATQPGMLIVCGDSHTSTHGAFGALAFGIGTSEVEHVLATQTLRQRKSRNLRVRFDGMPGPGVFAKDLALAYVRALGVSGGVGSVIEFEGPAISALSMEGRMTVCNMAIEAGARSGIIAPDQTTIDYLKDRARSPRETSWNEAEAWWRLFASDDDVVFDGSCSIDVTALPPLVTWGTKPDDVIGIDDRIPFVNEDEDQEGSAHVRRALDYMGLEGGRPLMGVPIDRVFIGSCTNGRIEDLRSAAKVAHGRRVPASVWAMVVPGSGLVRRQAEAEGLDRIFREAGFDWREPGCSMCLAMNADRLEPGERCAATTNRNFEGRQGRGGRTHLMSPAMAAATALAGRIADVRDYL